MNGFPNRHAHNVLSLLGDALRQLEELHGFTADAEALAKYRNELASKMSDNDLL